MAEIESVLVGLIEPVLTPRSYEFYRFVNQSIVIGPQNNRMGPSIRIALIDNTVGVGYVGGAGCCQVCYLSDPECQEKVVNKVNYMLQLWWMP